MGPRQEKPEKNTVTASDAVELCRGKMLGVPSAIAEAVGLPVGTKYDLVAELVDLGTVTFHLLQDMEAELNREKAKLEEAARGGSADDIDRLVAHEARFRRMTLTNDSRLVLTNAVKAHLGLTPADDEDLYLYVRVRAGKLEILTMDRARRFMLQNS